MRRDAGLCDNDSDPKREFQRISEISTLCFATGMGGDATYARPVPLHVHLNHYVNDSIEGLL